MGCSGTCRRGQSKTRTNMPVSQGRRDNSEEATPAAGRSLCTLPFQPLYDNTKRIFTMPMPDNSSSVDRAMDTHNTFAMADAAARLTCTRCAARCADIIGCGKHWAQDEIANKRDMHNVATHTCVSRSTNRLHPPLAGVTNASTPRVPQRPRQRDSADVRDNELNAKGFENASTTEQRINVRNLRMQTQTGTPFEATEHAGCSPWHHSAW